MSETPSADAPILPGRIDQLIVDYLAHGQHLAEMSRDGNGERCCCVCGGPAAVCIAPGWGGVYACRTCTSGTGPRP